MAKTMKSKPAKNIDEYIAVFPKDVQKKLKEMRTTIRKVVPQAEEAIKYAIPTYVLNRNLVSFAAFKNHIGLYPVPREVEAFKKELANYAGAKATAQFPLDKPLPLKLVVKIVKFLVKRSGEKLKAKSK